jgi:glutamate-ammonia-ligase adenylyltransferase
MSKNLASALTRCPRIFNTDRAHDAENLVGDLPSEVRSLVVGAASGSPYLLGLMQKEADWLRGAVADPVAAVGDVIMTAQTAPFDVIGDTLRQGKRRGRWRR